MYYPNIYKLVGGSNIDKINFGILRLSHDESNWQSLNSITLTVDYKALDNRINIYKEELMMVVFHPRRFLKYLEMGYNMGDDSYSDD